MSSGYRFSKGEFEPRPWEVMTGLAPAGAISATATDIARFMLGMFTALACGLSWAWWAPLV